MNFTQVNIFTVSVGIEQQEKSYVKALSQINRQQITSNYGRQHTCIYRSV